MVRPWATGKHIPFIYWLLFSDTRAFEIKITGCLQNSCYSNNCIDASEWYLNYMLMALNVTLCASSAAILVSFVFCSECSCKCSNPVAALRSHLGLVESSSHPQDQQNLFHASFSLRNCWSETGRWRDGRNTSHTLFNAKIPDAPEKPRISRKQWATRRLKNEWVSVFFVLATWTSHSENFLKLHRSCGFSKLLTAQCPSGERCDAKLTLV